MKILGISFGRKDRSCDLITKQALIAARDAGAEVKFINTIKLNIGHCKSCAACIIGRDHGGQVKCAVKDDYQILEEEILNADGIIVAAPVYALAPVGQLKNFIDRFGPAHDIAGLTFEQEKRKKEGKELLDERMFSKKYVAYISVGGAVTRNWVSMGLPNFKMFAASSCWIPTGQLDVWDMGRRANPVFDEQLMRDAAGLGKHMVECNGKTLDEVNWYGEEGVCPVCHNSLISIRGDADQIECPICGIRGTLEVKNKKIKITFSQKEQNRARGRWEGQLEHYNEINSMVAQAIPKLKAHEADMPKLLEPFTSFENTY